MMSDEGYSFSRKIQLGTALYYGLYTDTNQFSEIFNPLDMDMRDSVACNKNMINLFRNSNISRKELETAGIALIRNTYNEDYKFSIIKSEPCDPNILGIISDFLLQVDGIDTCVVYSEERGGFKFSVRSCVKEVRANELAVFLCSGIGSGGGHNEKAGGFINLKQYDALHSGTNSEAFFNQRLNEYYETTKIIVAKDYDMKVHDLISYTKKKLPIGYVKVSEILPIGTPITVRTLEGDMDMTVMENLLVMIGIKGEVYPYMKEKFEKSYAVMNEKYNINLHTAKPEYVPTIRNRLDGTSKTLVDYAKVCVPTGETYISAFKLNTRVKVFTNWDEEKYMLGVPGDYLAVRSDD
jgi:phosphoglycolate phosphatase